MVRANRDWLARNVGSIYPGMHWSLVVMLCRSMAEFTVKTSEDDSPSGKSFALGEHQRSLDQSYGTGNIQS
jgi:hypothetical protein